MHKKLHLRVLDNVASEIVIPNHLICKCHSFRHLGPNHIMCLGMFANNVIFPKRICIPLNTPPTFTQYLICKYQIPISCMRLCLSGKFMQMPCELIYSYMHNSHAVRRDAVTWRGTLLNRPSFAQELDNNDSKSCYKTPLLLLFLYLNWIISDSICNLTAILFFVFCCLWLPPRTIQLLRRLHCRGAPAHNHGIGEGLPSLFPK